MTDGHTAPPADAPAQTTAADNATAPAPSNAGLYGVQNTTSIEREKANVGRMTPRPTFLEHLATSRDSQFHLDRRDSSELDRYFVCLCHDAMVLIRLPQTRTQESQLETNIALIQHGPRDMEKHSKWPMMMRMHGSVMPRMILPILTVAAWSTAVTVFSKKVHDREFHISN